MSSSQIRSRTTSRFGFLPSAGFTLIELLVVIAIIAILAAILFPVFAQAREKARQTACLSNEKQIANAMMMYTQDFDETLFPYRLNAGAAQLNPFASDPKVAANAKTPIFFSQLLYPYTKNYDIFKCPSNPKAWVNVCPDEFDPALKLGPDLYQSYGAENSYAASNYTFRAGSGLPLAKIESTSETVGLVDSMYYNALPLSADGSGPCKLKGEQDYGKVGGPVDPTGGSYPEYWKNIGNSYRFDAPVPSAAQAITRGKARHQSMINVVWLDGHAKAVAYDKLRIDAGLAAGSQKSIWDPYKKGCQ